MVELVSEGRVPRDSGATDIPVGACCICAEGSDGWLIGEESRAIMGGKGPWAGGTPVVVRATNSSPPSTPWRKMSEPIAMDSLFLEALGRAIDG